MTECDALNVIAQALSMPVRRLVKERLLRTPPKFKFEPTIKPGLIAQQSGRCPLCLNLLPENVAGEIHIDHVITVLEATTAWEAGESLASVYQRLWARENLRAVHRSCNNARRPKQVRECVQLMPAAAS